MFSGDKLPNLNALWIAKNSKSTDNKKYPNNSIFYNDILYLYHYQIGQRLYIDNNHKSPLTGHAEGNTKLYYINHYIITIKHSLLIKF